jgi:hypothetical protein
VAGGLGLGARLAAAQRLEPRAGLLRSKRGVHKRRFVCRTSRSKKVWADQHLVYFSISVNTVDEGWTSKFLDPSGLRKHWSLLSGRHRRYQVGERVPLDVENLSSESLNRIDKPALLSQG